MHECVRCSIFYSFSIDMFWYHRWQRIDLLVMCHWFEIFMILSLAIECFIDSCLCQWFLYPPGWSLSTNLIICPYPKHRNIGNKSISSGIWRGKGYLPRDWYIIASWQVHRLKGYTWSVQFPFLASFPLYWSYSGQRTLSQNLVITENNCNSGLLILSCSISSLALLSRDSPWGRQRGLTISRIRVTSLYFVYHFCSIMNYIVHCCILHIRLFAGLMFVLVILLQLPKRGRNLLNR